MYEILYIILSILMIKWPKKKIYKNMKSIFEFFVESLDYINLIYRMTKKPISDTN